ncbi:hypothetical protein [Roseobacter fucihabitans]|uniref:hypothetical protein n=1 Tax=Roseobacter fucihabitans TaxID=1537242 RepID=UPI0016532A78|nr:hypothetical protein [Roseobacter litoralis]
MALICAMALSAFSHSGVRAAVSPDLAAYVAAGGSLSDICAGLDGKDDAQRQNCEACRLMGAALVPPSSPALPLVVTDQTRRLIFVAKELHRTCAPDRSRLTRAPPQV